MSIFNSLVAKHEIKKIKLNDGVDTDVYNSDATLVSFGGMQVVRIRTYSSAGVNQLAVSGNIVAVKTIKHTNKSLINLKKIYLGGGITLQSGTLEDN